MAPDPTLWGRPTSVFPYIAAPILEAYHLKKPSVEINPGETDVSEYVTVKLPLRAAVALDGVWGRAKN
jgi:NAD-dependent deacetylase